MLGVTTRSAMADTAGDGAIRVVVVLQVLVDGERKGVSMVVMMVF